MQVVHALLMVLVFRASLRSAAKNHGAPGAVQRQAYLPLKVNLFLYFVIGQALVWFFADNLTVLQGGYAVQQLGFGFACYSGMLFVSRSSA
ncbi:MAG TPA: hypothetical protein PKW28_01885 [Turneriella sp.]|nr:hypothetical protein [Turneriella sp.]